MAIKRKKSESSNEEDTNELKIFKEKINPLLDKAVNNQSSFQFSLIVENNEKTFNFTKKPYQYDKIRDPIFKNIVDNYNKFNCRNSKFFLDKSNDVEKILCYNNDSDSSSGTVNLDFKIDNNHKKFFNNRLSDVHVFLVEIKNIFFQDHHFEKFLNEIDESVTKNCLINYSSYEGIAQSISSNNNNCKSSHNNDGNNRFRFRIIKKENLENLKHIQLYVNCPEEGGNDSDNKFGKENGSKYSYGNKNHINKKMKSNSNSSKKKNSNHYIYYLIFVKEKGGKGSINGPFTTVSLKTYFQRGNYFNGLLMKGRYSKYLCNLNNIIKNVETFKPQFNFKIKTNFFDFESFYGQHYLEKIENMTSIKEFANILKLIKKLNTDFPLENHLLHNENIQHELEELKFEILNQMQKFKRDILEEQKNLLAQLQNNIIGLQNTHLEILKHHIDNSNSIFNNRMDNNILSGLPSTNTMTTTAADTVASTNFLLSSNIFNNLGSSQHINYEPI